MFLKGKGTIEAIDRVKLTITMQRVDPRDKRKKETLYKNSHYFTPKEYWELVNKINFDCYLGPTHLSLFGTYSDHEREEEEFFDKREECFAGREPEDEC